MTLRQSGLTGAWRAGLHAAVLAAAIALGGCATAPAQSGGSTAASAPVAPASPADPWENFNRKVFAFNQVVDDNVLVPVATAWRDTVPQFMRTGLANVFNNFNDITSALNHLLQGRFLYGMEMGMRVMSNTIFGVGGLVDPATEFGLVRRPQDYGQTLAHWGVGSGPFLVLPFFGPSTVRDALVVPAQLILPPSPTMFVDDWAWRMALTTGFIIDTRAQLLGATQLIDSIALDKYSFTRDAFLARRAEATGAAPALDTFIDEPDDAPPAAPTAPAAPAAPAAPVQSR
jgi:phospholipid-binding lipoprotein MlaA